MKIEVSIGEIVDKLSILFIKKEKIKDNSKLENIVKEFEYLNIVVFQDLNIENDDFLKLVTINESLWDVEDRLRILEKEQRFGGEFIDLARKVYFTNDKRAEIKKEINIKYGSNFVEEKSYEKY